MSEVGNIVFEVMRLADDSVLTVEIRSHLWLMDISSGFASARFEACGLAWSVVAFARRVSVCRKETSAFNHCPGRRGRNLSSRDLVAAPT